MHDLFIILSIFMVYVWNNPLSGSLLNKEAYKARKLPVSDY